MGTRIKAPSVNKRIKQLKKQKKVTGGSAVALPPGVTVKRKKAKAKRKKLTEVQQAQKDRLVRTL